MAEFDVDSDLVRKLSALLEECGLTELEVTNGDHKIRLSRGAVMAPVAAAPAAAPATDAATAPEGHPGAITAPMVGTVYLSPEPGADAFVKVGDAVNEGQTLLLIEAMKTYNPVRATRAGKVAAILVSDAAPVEFGEDLMILE